MSILGSHYVNQAAPIAGIISAGVLGGFAGPGAPFLVAGLGPPSSQLDVAGGETPSSGALGTTVETPLGGVDALLTAAESLETPVPRHLLNSFSSTAVDPAANLMESVLGLSTDGVPGCVNFVSKEQSFSTVVFSVHADFADDKMGRSLKFSADPLGQHVRAVRYLDGVRAEFDVSSLSEATSFLHNTMSRALCKGLVYQDPRQADKITGRKFAFNSLLCEASQNHGQIPKTGQKSWFASSGFLSGGAVFASTAAAFAESSTRSTQSEDQSNLSRFPRVDVKFMLFSHTDTSVSRHVFRKRSCTLFTSAFGGECACESKNGKEAFRKVLECREPPASGGASDSVPLHTTHVHMARSPDSALHAIKHLSSQVASLKSQNRTLREKIEHLSESDEICVSNEVQALLSHPEIRAELARAYSKKPGEEGYREGNHGEDALAVWDSMLHNIATVAKHNGGRHGCRYPDVVLRLSASLLAKVGRKDYVDLQQMFFLPNVRTAQHYK